MTTDLTPTTQPGSADSTAPDPADLPELRDAAEHLLTAVHLADERAAADGPDGQLSAWANIAQRISLAASGVLLHVDEQDDPIREDDREHPDCAAALRAAAQQIAAVPLDAGLGVVATAEVLFQISRAQVEVQQLQEPTARAGQDGPERAGAAR